MTLPIEARLPWDHIDISMEPGFLADEYRKALASRVSPPCGKPFGAKVHATNVPDAEADARRLVCYDCGIACDMSEMRQERLVALRTLGELKDQRHGRERLEAEQASPTMIPVTLAVTSRPGRWRRYRHAPRHGALSNTDRAIGWMLSHGDGGVRDRLARRTAHRDAD